MNKNMTISMRVNEGSAFSLVSKAVETLNHSVEPVRKYYSDVLERPVDRRQMWHLLHAQVAFMMVAFPVECPLLLRAVFAAWFVVSVKMCRQALRSDK